MPATVFNEDLIKLARHRVREDATASKRAFVDAATAAGGGAGAAPPGADPMAGAMPPMPAMGGDPAAGGGDPAAAGGAAPPPAGVTADEVRMIVQEAVARSGGGQPGAAGAAGGPQKPKVDVPTEIYQIKKLLVQMAGAMGLELSPEILMGDPSQDPAIPPEQAAQDPMSAAATQAGKGIGSAIGGIKPLQPASPALAQGGGGGGQQKTSHYEGGVEYPDTRQSQRMTLGAFSGIDDTANRASALSAMIKAAKSQRENTSP